MPDPSALVAAALAHIERCIRRTEAGTVPGPVRPREFRANGATMIRVEPVDELGVVPILAATKGHAWRLEVFGRARRLKVRVQVVEMIE